MYEYADQFTIPFRTNVSQLATVILYSTETAILIILMICLLGKLSSIFSINNLVIKVFYVWKTVCPVQNLALVRDFPKIRSFKFVEDPLTHATGVQLTAVYLPELENLKVIPISAIKEKVVYKQFKGEETAFVSRFPNKVESD